MNNEFMQIKIDPIQIICCSATYFFLRWTDTPRETAMSIMQQGVLFRGTHSNVCKCVKYYLLQTFIMQDI